MGDLRRFDLMADFVAAHVPDRSVRIADAAAAYDAYADAAAADAGSKDWWKIRDAIYTVLRKRYRERFAGVIATNEASAQDLVRRMCALGASTEAAQ